MIAEQLVRVFKDRIPLSDRPGLDPVASTGWWLAYKVAESVFDLSIKDLARVVVDGGTLGGPYRTLEDIKRYFEEDYPDCWEDAELSDIETEVDQWLGIVR
jgi:hypothetical protein